jgi:hypothetical protein
MASHTAPQATFEQGSVARQPARKKRGAGRGATLLGGRSAPQLARVGAGSRWMDVGAHLVCEAGVAVELAIAPADAWAIGGTIGRPRRADARCIGLTASLFVVIIAERHGWLGTLQARESTACLATRVGIARGAARSSGSSGSTRTAGRPRPSRASRRVGGGVFTAAERCKDRTSYGDPHCTSGLKRGSSLMLFHAHPFRPVRESTDRAKASGHVRSGEIPGECVTARVRARSYLTNTRVHLFLRCSA